MWSRTHRSAARRARARTLLERAPLVLLLVVLALPAATAQDLPAPPAALSAPAPPTPPPLPGAQDEVDIDEHGLTFEGPADAPRRVLVVAPDGAPALSYEMDAEGRARLDIAGTNVVSDATLLAIEGDPKGDAFVLFLRDAEGRRHEVLIDREVLLANVDLPPEAQLPAIDVLRPPAWPGAPSRPFLLNVQDTEPNLLAAAALEGTRFLKLAGEHKAVLQLPTSDADFDRMILRATRAANGAALNVTFARSHATNDAVVFRASYLPGLLGLNEGDRVDVQPFYERRVTPLVVERFPENATYSYLVDGLPPSVTISAPAEADDFRFAIAWNGADGLSGLGGFTIDYREAGAERWTRWLDKAPAKSATFSGAWAKTYEFRAFSHDAVGNPSPASQTVTTTVKAPPGGSDDVNHEPTARLLTPPTGALVGGLASVTWTATDPDGTPVTSKLEVSADEGGTWRLLYVGTDASHTWDTTAEEDGPGYQIRLTVSDGTTQAFDKTGALTIRNVVAPPAPIDEPEPQTPPTPDAPATPPQDVRPANAPDAPTDAAAPDTTAAEEAPPKKGVPAPFIGGAIAAAALLARRRVIKE